MHSSDATPSALFNLGRQATRLPYNRREIRDEVAAQALRLPIPIFSHRQLYAHASLGMPKRFPFTKTFPFIKSR